MATTVTTAPLPSMAEVLCWEGAEPDGVLAAWAQSEVGRMHTLVGGGLGRWMLAVQPDGATLWGRLSVSWNGVRLHVDQDGPDLATLVYHALRALCILLGVASPRAAPLGI